MISRNLSPQWLKFLKSLGIEFWLPLPLLGLSFWFVGGWLTQQNLMHSPDIEVELQAIQPKKSSNNDAVYDYGVASIEVKIDSHRGISLVKVLKRTVKKSEFILLTTDFDTLETEISAELGLPREEVKKIMSLIPYSNKR